MDSTRTMVNDYVLRPGFLLNEWIIAPLDIQEMGSYVSRWVC